MLFNKIYNPKTNRWVKINSKKGKEILYYFINSFTKLNGGDSLKDLLDNITTDAPCDISLINFVN